jgi:hypothetical protein
MEERPAAHAVARRTPDRAKKIVRLPGRNFG